MSFRLSFVILFRVLEDCKTPGTPRTACCKARAEKKRVRWQSGKTGKEIY